MNRAHAHAQSHQSYLTLCDPMGCCLTGSSVHGLLQARILEWVAISSFRGSSQPKNQTHVSCIGRWILCYLATWEALKNVCMAFINLLDT